MIPELLEDLETPMMKKLLEETPEDLARELLHHQEGIPLPHQEGIQEDPEGPTAKTMEIFLIQFQQSHRKIMKILGRGLLKKLLTELFPLCPLSLQLTNRWLLAHLMVEVGTAPTCTSTPMVNFYPSL